MPSVPLSKITCLVAAAMLGWPAFAAAENLRINRHQKSPDQYPDRYTNQSPTQAPGQSGYDESMSGFTQSPFAAEPVVAAPASAGSPGSVFKTIVQPRVRPQHHENMRPSPAGGPPDLGIVDDTGPGAAAFKAQLSRPELRQLSQHDIVVIVDKSGSMSTRDCPAGGFTMLRSALPRISRWQWCKQELVGMTTRARGGLPNGITLVFFSSSAETFPGVSNREIPYIFDRRDPGGSTNAADALSGQLFGYFQRKASYGMRNRPTAVIFITDGQPSNPRQLRQIIIDASRQMTDPRELKITFLQIGTASGGTRLLRELDDRLVGAGARYDIVDSRSFIEVQDLGLARAILAAINETRAD